MGIAPSVDTSASADTPSGMIDEQVGEAYRTVQDVAEHIVDLEKIAASIPQLLGEDGWLGRTIADYAIDPFGLIDSTAGLLSLFSNNRRVYIGPGRYLIKRTGPNAGGVLVNLVRSLSVVCHPNAIFFTDDLDNDLIRFAVPSNGSGLPTDLIEFKWVGGTFDQRFQRVSASVPYATEFPPYVAAQGTSPTTDALSVRCSYTSGGVAKNAARLVHISDVSFIAGNHWQTSGGDSGIYAGEGAEEVIVERCYFKGNRDVSVYISRDTTGVAGRNATVRNNTFVNCFYGAAVKRGFTRAQIYGNTFDNCVHGPMANMVTGLPNDCEGVSIYGNTMENCHLPIRVDYTLAPRVYDNVIKSLGATLVGGEKFPYLVPCGITLAGCTHGKVFANLISGAAAAFAADATNFYGVELNDYNADGTIVPTTFTGVTDNNVVGIRQIGRETGTANDNVWRDNRSVNNQNTGTTVLGTRSVQARPFDTASSSARRFIGSVETMRESATEVRALVPIRVPSYTAAQLFAIPSPQDGWRAIVTDATVTFSSANFGAAYLSTQGGGTNKIPVTFMGGWKIG